MVAYAIFYVPYRSSAIFNAKKSALQTIEAKAVKKAGEVDGSDGEEEEEAAAYGRDKVDLTIEQTKMEDDDGMDEMDDFDLLDATIDPTDVKSLQRRHELETEIQYEQIKIQSKMLFKLAFSAENPLKIDE